MVTTIETTLTIRKTLFHEAEALAQQLNIAQNQLFECAIEQFIKDYQPSIQPASQHAVINQGDLYWVQWSGGENDFEPGISHPHVVLQENVFNHSRIHTVIVCALTSNLKRINMPGNVLLEAGEGNLPRQSVVEVSKVSTVDKTQLGEYIGALTEQRIQQITAGMRFLQTSFFAR